MYKFYHVFSNNTDEWVSSRREAVQIFKEYVDEYGWARLYEEDRDEDDEMVNENCIMSVGEYPM